MVSAKKNWHKTYQTGDENGNMPPYKGRIEQEKNKIAKIKRKQPPQQPMSHVYKHTKPFFKYHYTKARRRMLE